MSMTPTDLLHILCRSSPAAVNLTAALQVALVEQLLDEVWGGPWALVVNPGWHANTPAAYSGLVDSFEAAYSFMPIATQVWQPAVVCSERVSNPSCNSEKCPGDEHPSNCTALDFGNCAA